MSCIPIFKRAQISSGVTDILDNASALLKTGADALSFVPLPGLNIAATALSDIIERVKVNAVDFVHHLYYLLIMLLISKHARTLTRLKLWQSMLARSLASSPMPLNK